MNDKDWQDAYNKSLEKEYTLSCIRHESHHFFQENLVHILELLRKNPLKNGEILNTAEERTESLWLNQFISRRVALLSELKQRLYSMVFHGISKDPTKAFMDFLKSFH